MTIFSKRYEDQLRNRSLKVSLPKRLRGRIWNLLKQSEFQVGKVDETNWHFQVSVFQDVIGDLLLAYGTDKLYALESFDQPSAKKVPVELDGFVKGAYPSQVFDVLEVFAKNSPPEIATPFYFSLNQIFDEERCHWRIINGLFFKMDNEFMEAHVLSKAQTLMKLQGFNGALEEFEEARRGLTAGDAKGAIQNAALSFESVLKTVADQVAGNASTLIRKLDGIGFWDDLPAHVRKAFEEQVMMTLPTIRNRLSGHGQGKDTVEIPLHYGELAIGLAACFNLFLINKVTAQQRVFAAPETPPEEMFCSDEIPF